MRGPSADALAWRLKFCLNFSQISTPSLLLDVLWSTGYFEFALVGNLLRSQATFLHHEFCIEFQQIQEPTPVPDGSPMVCCPTSAQFAPTVQTASFDQHSLWSWTRNEDLLWESRSTPKGRALLASKLRTSCIGCQISGSSTRFESVFKLVFYSN